ncbi:MAG: putative agmatine deiminase [Lachnoclostridium sp.]
MIENNQFFMPGEWEKHERTLMEWPVKESMVWPDNYEEFCEGFLSVAKAISEFEPVTIIVNPGERVKVQSLCGALAEILEIPHNDAWCRDNGPTILVNKKGERLGINWRFNAWGEKYKPYDLDDKVAKEVLRHLQIPAKDVLLVLEGGSIHADGEGTLLTTKQCLLNTNRNPALTQEKIEEILKEVLKVNKIIWLEKGLDGDETDGHIDNIACFARPGVVLIQTCYDKKDPNYDITMENLDILRHTRDAWGRKLTVIEIPQPPARFYKNNRLTLSYLNFYMVNRGIILPVFKEEGADTDLKAERILSRVFPDRKIVTVDGMALIKEGGNVHCITQQIPAGIAVD